MKDYSGTLVLWLPQHVQHNVPKDSDGEFNFVRSAYSDCPKTVYISMADDIRVARQPGECNHSRHRVPYAQVVID